MRVQQSVKMPIGFLLLLGGAIVGAAFLITWLWGYATWQAWWASNVLHLGGGVYGFFFVRALFERTRRAHGIYTYPWMEAILFVGGAIVLGVAWEWYEFMIDRYSVLILGLPSLMSYADNIGDLGTDTLGALIAAGIFLARRNSRAKR